MSELAKKTVTELATLMEKGTCSSVDLVTDVLAAIEEKDSLLGGYLSYNAGEALEQAEHADQRRKQGEKHPLLGIPIAVKDLLNIRGQTCTCGSHILAGYTAPYDATAMAKLRKQGAIFLGRTNMDEFAMGSSTENSAYQITKNPWDTSRVPGGSSGGSAAVVAAHEAIVAIGSDTGGSIRQPASFCGCVGLKPTYGRISRYGLTAFASSLDQIGPLTKTVKDAAVLLEAMAGIDPLDSTSNPKSVPHYLQNLSSEIKGMKLGIPEEYFIKGIDPDVEQAVRAAIDQCAALGAEIIPVQLPHTKYAVATYYIIATAEASTNLARFDGIRYGNRVDADNPIDLYLNTRASGFGAEVKRRIILGTYVLSSGYYDAYYVKAQKARTLIARDFDAVFEQCDALLCPVSPTPAYKTGDCSDDPLKMYLGDIFTVTANLAGICGLSVPCGFTTDGLPIGLQILGPAFAEENILKIGHAYEIHSNNRS